MKLIYPSIRAHFNENSIHSRTDFHTLLCAWLVKEARYACACLPSRIFNFPTASFLNDGSVHSNASTVERARTLVNSTLHVCIAISQKKRRLNHRLLMWIELLQQPRASITVGIKPVRHLGGVTWSSYGKSSNSYHSAKLEVAHCAKVDNAVVCGYVGWAKLARRLVSRREQSFFQVLQVTHDSVAVSK